MDNQEIFNQIRELQKQRTLLSAQDTALVNKINELRDKIVLKNIKKGYYTDNNGLYCKVYDQKQEYDVYVVWQCYILGNAKWLLSTTLPDDMYYEVTYNKVKDEFYLDAYKKFENRCIPNK